MQSSCLCSSGFLSNFFLTTRNRCIIWFAVFNFNSSKSVSIVIFFFVFSISPIQFEPKKKSNKFTCNNEKSNKLNFRVNSLSLPKWGCWQYKKKTKKKKERGGNLVIYNNNNNWKWGKHWENSWESTLLELFGAAKRYTSKLLHTLAQTHTHIRTHTGETTQRDKCVWPSHSDRTKESNNRDFFLFNIDCWHRKITPKGFAVGEV